MNLATETAMVRVTLPSHGYATSESAAEEGSTGQSSLADRLAKVGLQHCNVSPWDAEQP